MNKFSKIILGTAQFGSNYGISNKKGVLENKEIKKILNSAKKYKVKFIDTAISYTNANTELSLNNIKNFKIITKTPKLKNLSRKSCVKEQIISNLVKFKKKINYKKKIFAYLIHSPADMRSKNAKKIFKALNFLKKKGEINNIGICIEKMNDLDFILNNKIKIDLIECPVNIFDQRLLNYKNLDKIKKKKIKIFARSIFLQGLLLLPKKQIPNYFKKWTKEIDNWHIFLKKNNISALQGCINFILLSKIIDKFIVGVQTSSELLQIIRIIEKKKKYHLIFKDLNINDTRLINSENWK